MRSPIILAAVTVAAVASFTACGSDSATKTTTSITYVATLNAANERPNANSSTGTGTATYTLTGDTLRYTVSVTGLTGDARAAHIHVGSAATAGGVIVPYTLTATTGIITSGSILLSQPIVNGTTSITGDSLKVLLNTGNAYTNVHTTLNGGGEVRGQIIKQ